MFGILENEGEGRKWKDRKAGKFKKLLLEANTIGIFRSGSLFVSHW